MELTMTVQKVGLQKKVIICMGEMLLWESSLIHLKGGGRWQRTGDDRYSRRGLATTARMRRYSTCRQ